MGSAAAAISGDNGRLLLFDRCRIIAVVTGQTSGDRPAGTQLRCDDDELLSVVSSRLASDAFVCLGASPSSCP